MKASGLPFDQSEGLWPTTKRLIPTGSQTFSKAPMQHVSGVSPKYIVRGKGPRVWDLDGNEYIDYMMGLGPVILGHADDEVNAAVINAVNMGISPSLPHPIETELAQRLIELIPCAEMVRFAKNGSDATTAAIRVARAFTHREKIACCGYHGWRGWYIGSTSRNLGVPQCVQDLTYRFGYNDIDSLKLILNQNKGEIAAIIMEPVSFHQPEDWFLEKVKDLANKHSAVLIFDEIITGLRMAMGGAQEYFKVTPDLACYGKALGNGMPISALVGRRKIMTLFEEVFFSMTFGGEIASIAAALATIRAMQARGGIRHIWQMGIRLFTRYNAMTAGLPWTEMAGYPFWPEYRFLDAKGKVDRVALSLFQQEIVRRGILTRAGMMISVSHTEREIDETLKVFSKALEVVKEAKTHDKVREWLDGEVIQPVIRQ